jgi:hypothetical protein
MTSRVVAVGDLVHLSDYTFRSGYWCAMCPTRIVVESERATAHVTPTICPNCGGELVEVSDLVARKAIPYPESPKDVVRLHHQWLQGPRAP